MDTTSADGSDDHVVKQRCLLNGRLTVWAYALIYRGQWDYLRVLMRQRVKASSWSGRPKGGCGAAESRTFSRDRQTLARRSANSNRVGG